MKLISSLVVLALVLISAVALPGGWTPIDPKDAHVVKIGKYAVSAYNARSKAHLIFKQVVSGQSQVVAGTNYKLIIAAAKGAGRRNGEATKKYEAIVWEKPWVSFKNLTSFTEVSSHH